MPDGDFDYPTRWNLLKGHFSRAIARGERISPSRQGKRERGIWQRRFWAHLITDQNDFNKHIDYIHWNPVKHGLVERVSDWPYSSFRYFVKQGIYPLDWGIADEVDFDAGESLLSNHIFLNIG